MFTLSKELSEKIHQIVLKANRIVLVRYDSPTTPGGPAFRLRSIDFDGKYPHKFELPFSCNGLELWHDDDRVLVHHFGTELPSGMPITIHEPHV